MPTNAAPVRHDFQPKEDRSIPEAEALSSPTGIVRPSDVLFRRQPIYNARLDVVGYELLFCGDHDLKEPRSADRGATAQLLADAFIDRDLDSVTGGKPAFVNATVDFLLKQRVRALPPHQVVIGIPEDIRVDEQLLASIEQMRLMGYIFALDNFGPSQDRAQLLELVDYIKVDLQLWDTSQLTSVVDDHRHYQARLLADNVESKEEFEICKGAGFELFQGFFLCKPGVVRGQRSPPSQLSNLKLIQDLRRPDVETKEVEAVFKTDALLTYKLFRLSNSALYGRRHRIDSVCQALRHLGLLRVADWASILLLTRISDKPHALLSMALVRAMMCESLAKTTGQPSPDKFFLGGLLSLMDAMLDRPMEEVAAVLPLHPDIIEALVFMKKTKKKFCIVPYKSIYFCPLLRGS